MSAQLHVPIYLLMSSGSSDYSALPKSSVSRQRAGPQWTKQKLAMATKHSFLLHKMPSASLTLVFLFVVLWTPLNALGFSTSKSKLSK
jgi:hypothetical protein